LNSNLEKAKQKVVLLEGNIKTVKAASGRVEELRKRASQARKLVGERTAMAQTLEMVGQSLPEHVWFDEIDIDKSGNDKEITIYGYAYNDALIASLMGALEEEKATENVRLIFSERVMTADIYKESAFSNRSLVKFEIRVADKGN
jgi:Tfp pilus assembly protein PilN